MLVWLSDMLHAVSRVVLVPDTTEEHFPSSRTTKHLTQRYSSVIRARDFVNVDVLVVVSMQVVPCRTLWDMVVPCENLLCLRTSRTDMFLQHACTKDMGLESNESDEFDVVLVSPTCMATRF